MKAAILCCVISQVNVSSCYIDVDFPAKKRRNTYSLKKAYKTFTITN